MRRGNSIHLSESRHLLAKAVLHWLVLREYLSPKGCKFLDGFLRRIFSEGRDVTKKSEERVVIYADELFEERRSDSGKSRSKSFCEEIFRMARRSEGKARNA